MGRASASQLERLLMYRSAERQESVISDVAGWAKAMFEGRNALARTTGKGMGHGVFELEQRTTAIINPVLVFGLGFSDEIREPAANDVL